MSTKLVIGRDNQLNEFRNLEGRPKNPLLRILAGIISYVFHPLFIPVYIILFLMDVHPYLFASFTAFDKATTVARFIIIYSFFPLVTVLLAKGLGFLQSFYLKTQKDRVIPYIACGIYYFWMSYVLRHQAQFASQIVQLSIAIFLASSLGLLVNIYMKVSMHAISMGVMLVFVALVATSLPANSTPYIALTVLITGLVCTSRLIVSDHSPKEIYIGLITGAASQLLAVWADKILP